MEDLSEKIRLIREEKKLTQNDVAMKLQTERSNYARLEKRGLDITVRQLLDIAHVLGVSVGELLGVETLENLNGRISTQDEKINELMSFVNNYKEKLNDKNKIIELYNEIFTLIKNNLNKGKEENSKIEQLLDSLSK